MNCRRRFNENNEYSQYIVLKNQTILSINLYIDGMLLLCAKNHYNLK